MFGVRLLRLSGAIVVLGFVFAAGLAAPSAQAATYTWDASGNGTTFDNSGTWSTTSAFWWNGSDSAWTTSGTDSAVFGNGGAGPYTITVSGSVGVGGITFNSGSLYNISGGTIALDTASPVITMNASSGTIGSLLTGSNGLTMTGSGLLGLTGANTYTGTTTVSGGTLQLQGSAFSTTARSYSITSGAVLSLLALGGSDASGTSVATGTTTFSGSGTLQIASGWLNNNAAAGHNVTMSLGSGGVINVQAGAGIQNGGFQNTTWTNNLGSLNLNGTLDIWDGNLVIVDALTGSGTATHTGFSGASNALEIGVNNGSGTFSGVITQGSGLTTALIKAGSGVETLTGANLYSGGTTISGGTLQIGTGGSLLNTGSVILGSGTGSGVLTLGNGAAAVNQTVAGLTINGSGTANAVNSGSVAVSTLTVGSGGISANTAATISAPVTISTGQTWTNNSASSINVVNNVSTGGNGLTVAGSGGVTISGAVSGGGGLAVNNGGLLTFSGSGGAFSAFNLGNASNTSGGTLNISSGTASFSARCGIGSANGARGVVNISGNSSVSIGGDLLMFGGNGASNLNASGLINQSGGVLNVNTTSGVLMPWAGGSPAAFGAYLLSSGTLNGPNGGWRVNNQNNDLGLFSQSGGAANFINDFVLNNNGGCNFPAIADVSGGTLTHKTAGNLMATQANLGVLTIRGSGYLQEQTGNFFLTNAAAGTGIVNLISGGTLEANKIQNSAGAATINFDGGTLRAYSSNAGSSWFSGLTNAFVYSGGLTIDGNNQNLSIGQALKAPAGFGIRTSGATIAISSSGGSGYIAPPVVTFAAPASGIAATGVAVINAAGTVTGIVVTSPGSGYTSSQSVAITFNGGTNAANEAATVATFPGVTASTLNASGGLTMVNGGTLTLTGSNGYGGATTVSAGTLVAGSANANAFGSGGGLVTNGGVLETNGNNFGFANLSGSSGQVINGNASTASTVTVGSDGSSSSYGGALADGGAATLSLTKTGAGLLTLAGSNTYSGATAISGGTLAINGSLATASNVAVGNAGTLAGSGLVSGPTTLTGNGAINLSGGTIGNTLNVTGGFWKGTGSVTGTITSSSGLFTIGSGANLAANAGLNLSGGTLCGAGTVSAGTLTLGSGALIAPGATPANGNAGTLTLPSLSTNGGGTFNFDLSGSTAGSNDLIAVSNNLTLSGSSTLNVFPSGGSLASGVPYTLFTYGGVLTQSSSNPFNLVSSAIGARQTPTFNFGAGTNSAITLTIAGFNANLTWVGTNSTTWVDNGGSGPLSWYSTTSTNTNGADFFTAGDTVTFNNLAGTTVATLSGAVSPGSVTVTGTNNFTFTGGGSIAGATGLTVTGPGSLLIANSGGNSYNGATAIQGGKITLGVSNGLPTAGTLVLGTSGSAGTFDLSGFNQTVGGLAVGSGATAASQIITSSTGSSTFTYNGGASAFNGTLQDTAPSGGTLGLTVSGGTLNASGGSTTYHGATTVNGGVLLVAALPNTSGVSVGAAGGLNVTGTNLTLAAVSNLGSVAFTSTSGTITLASLTGTGTTSFFSPSAAIGNLGTANLSLNSTALSVSAGSQTSAGSIGGAGSLAMVGSGTLSLGGNNTYNGGTTLSSGLLDINSNSALGTGTFTIAGGTIDSTAAGVTLAGNPQNWNADITFLGTQNLNLGSGAVTLGGSRTVTVNSNTLTVGGAFSGSNSLTKSGTGTLSLASAANTGYGGSITVSQGVLAFNNAGSAGTATSVTLGDANTGASAVSVKFDTGLTGQVNLGNLYTSSFGTAQTVVLNGGSSLGANGAAYVGTWNLSGSVPLTVQATNTGGHSTAQDWDGRIVGTGVSVGSTALILDGSVFPLRLTFGNGVGAAANNFTGDVLIKGNVTTQGNSYLGAGVASYQNLGFLNNNVTVSSGASWSVVWGGETTGGLNGSGNISLGNQNALNNIGLTVGNNNANGSYSGSINGGFAVAKTGSGTQVLASGNSYSGGTYVSGGTLQLGNNSALGTGGLFANAGALDMAGHSVTVPSFSGAAGTVTNSGGSISTLTVNQSISTVFNGTLADGNNKLALLTTGSGSLTLGGSSTYSGGTTITNGTLIAASNLAFGSGTLTLSGGSLTTSGQRTVANPIVVTASTITNVYGTSGGANYPILTGAITGGGTLQNNNTSGGGLGNAFISGDISGFTGTINYVNVSGASNNFQFTGTTPGSINGSQAQFVLGGVTNVNNGGMILENSGQTFQMGALSGTGGVIGTTVTETLQVGALNTSTTFAGTVGGFGGTLAFSKVGTGKLTLAGTNTYNGGTTINAGTLQYGIANALLSSGNVNVNGATATLDLGGFSPSVGTLTLTSGTVQNGTLTGTAYAVQNGTISASLGDVGGSALQKTTAGTVVLSASNGYTGGTTLSNGVLAINNVASLGAASGALSINSGTLEVASSFADARNIALTSANAAIQVDPNQTYTNSGTISGSGALNAVGAGTLVLGGSDTYSGGTNVAAGTLHMGTANALPYGANKGNVTVNGLLDLSGETTNVNGLGGSGVVDNTAGAPVTLIVGNNNATSTFLGILQNTGGALALTKLGSGTFTLGAASNYSGPTSVQSGILTLGAGGAMTGPVSVTGGTLDASGFTQSIYSITMGSLGTLGLGLGNVISSAGTDGFAGTLDISGIIHTGELMSYTGHNGTFTTVNGLTSAYQLLYGGTELDIVSSGPATWSAAGSGSWNTGANWTSGSAPSGVGVTAIVGTGTGTNVSITLDTPQTLGTLVFSNTAGNSSAGYSLDAGTAGTGSLTLDNSGAAALITVNVGSHAITAPVYLVGGDLTVSASGNGVLTISGSISQDTTRNLTLNGDGSGSLILSGTNNLGGIGGTVIVSSGTLVLNSNEALADGTSLTVGDASFFGGIQPAGAAADGTRSVPATLVPVPEPATLVLLAAGLAMLATYRKRRQR